MFIDLLGLLTMPNLKCLSWETTWLDLAYRLKSWSSALPPTTVWPWINYLAFLSFEFFTHKEWITYCQTVSLKGWAMEGHGSMHQNHVGSLFKIPTLRLHPQRFWLSISRNSLWSCIFSHCPKRFWGMLNYSSRDQLIIVLISFLEKYVVSCNKY